MMNTGVIASSAFKPTRYSTLKVWLDGSDPANGAKPTNGTTVQNIINKGSGSVTCTQATAGNRATFISGAYNGKGILRTTTNIFYSISGFTFGTSTTVFMIATPSTIAGAYLYGSSGTSSSPSILSSFSSQSYEYFVVTGGVTQRSTIGAAGATGMNVVEFSNDATTVTTKLNGTTSFSGATTASMSGAVLSKLFSSDGTTNYCGIDFAGLLVFSPELNSTQAIYVRKWLGKYWGITVI
jgi:hypothetical protein